jgi:hypothetical protein
VSSRVIGQSRSRGAGSARPCRRRSAAPPVAAGRRPGVTTGVGGASAPGSEPASGSVWAVGVGVGVGVGGGRRRCRAWASGWRSAAAVAVGIGRRTVPAGWAPRPGSKRGGRGPRPGRPTVRRRPARRSRTGSGAASVVAGTRDGVPWLERDRRVGAPYHRRSTRRRSRQSADAGRPQGRARSAAYAVPMSDEITKTADDWRAELTPEQYHVLREKGTERAFTGAYWDEHGRRGLPLRRMRRRALRRGTKFDSGSGWPSFYAADGRRRRRAPRPTARSS